MRFVTRVFGPGPIPGGRVLLAAPGQDYTDDEGAAIIAQAVTTVTVEGRDDPIVPATPTGPADTDPVPDEHGIINRGNGWYELPDGERIRGRDNAIAAALAAEADPDGTSGNEDGGDIVVTVDGPDNGPDGPDLDGPEDNLENTEPETAPVPGELETLGGGWFRLPNGERVRGRDEAEEALAALPAEDAAAAEAAPDEAHLP